MARDSQPVTTTHRHVLWAAGAGAGLLALSYLLGVQVGKQGVALRKPLPSSSDEPLQELPEPLLDQLQAFESSSAKLVPVQKPEAPKAEAPKAEAAAPTKAPEAKPDAKPDAKAERWTLQLVSTSDAAEAKRVADKAKAAGYAAALVKEKGVTKVRLAKGGSKEDIDALAAKLKKAGFKPFAVKQD